MDKYYQVVAKCGHVGRNNYYKANLYVPAKDAKEAAKVAREKPRVKHDHKDAILSVTEITYTEFNRGRQANNENPYFLCDSVQEQRAYIEKINESIFRETVVENYCNKERDTKREIYFGKEKIRRPQIFSRMNMFAAEDCYM